MKNLSERSKMMIRRVGMLVVVAALFVVAVWVNADEKGKSPAPVPVSVRSDTPASAWTPTPKPQSTSAGQEDVPSAADVASGDYYANFRKDRESIRNEQVDLLNSVIEGKDADGAKKAAQEKINLAKNMEKEFAVEKMITAKGFADAAAIVREGQVMVVVKQEKLSQSEVNMIMALIVQETQEDLVNIKIIPSP